VFLAIWNFLRGHVRIEISGFSVERFINQAIAQGLVFWDLRRAGGKFSACVSRRDYLRSRILCEKTGSRLVALAFYGLPPLLMRLRKRAFLAVGGLVFIVGIVALTSFVWRVDIEGTSRLDPAEMLVFLEENDLHVGRFRRGIAYRDIENKLMLEFSDIAWVSISLRGTRALVTVVETIDFRDEQAAITEGEFIDIVAAMDGVIVYMATSAGEPLFRPGDVVRAGEIVVAGRLMVGSAEEGNLSYRYVRANSEVWARVYHTLEIEVPFAYYEKTFTGSSSRSYSFSLGSWEFSLPFNFGANHDFIYYENIVSRWQASVGEDYPLPISRTRNTSYELVRHMRSRSPEQAEHLALELVTRRIEEEMAATASILDKQISFTQNERSLIAQISLITIERIDQPQSLLPEPTLPE